MSESDIKLENLVSPPKLSGEINCRAFNLLDGYNPPRAYFATDCGTFYIILGEAQIASMVADGANILHKQIAQKK